MKNWILILLIVFTSCKITKDKTTAKTNTKNDIDRTQVEVIKTKREGGLVQKVYYPLFELRAKDSTDITRHGSAEVKTIYKKDGSVQATFSCDEIWQEIERRLNERDKTQTFEKTTEKHKTTEIPREYVLYAVGLLIIITIGAMWYVTWSVKKNLKILNILK